MTFGRFLIPDFTPLDTHLLHFTVNVSSFTSTSSSSYVSVYSNEGIVVTNLFGTFFAGTVGSVELDTISVLVVLNSRGESALQLAYSSRDLQCACSHGYCLNDTVCTCDDCWSGEDCSLATECLCVNGVQISDGVCTCYSGWTGGRCDIASPCPAVTYFFNSSGNVSFYSSLNATGQCFFTVAPQATPDFPEVWVLVVTIKNYTVSNTLNLPQPRIYDASNEVFFLLYSYPAIFSSADHFASIVLTYSGVSVFYAEYKVVPGCNEFMYLQTTHGVVQYTDFAMQTKTCIWEIAPEVPESSLIKVTIPPFL